MDVDLDVPGGHGRLRFSGGWPAFEDLVDLAHALAEFAWRCPDCADVPAEEFQAAMARVAPPELASRLRAAAGLEPEPGAAARALAATYERHAEELAAIEAIRTAPPGR